VAVACVGSLWLAREMAMARPTAADAAKMDELAAACNGAAASE
jgi:hypothetical protein